MKKLLKTMLASLALAALVVSCGTAFQIGNINLDDPEVTAESKFGGVLLSWDKVDMADVYYIYRAEPVEADAKKAKSDATYEEKELIGTINKSKESGKIYFADKIRIGNVLEEGKTYQYTVEAIAGDGSDARVAATADEADKQYARGTCVIEVTIAEGTAPAFGTKVTAPTKTSFINYATSEYLNREKGAKIKVLKDVLDDDYLINTWSFVEYSALSGQYNAYSVPGYSYSTQIMFYTDADGVVELPLAGEYTVKTYNSTGNNYYIDSDYVAAEEKVVVSFGEEDNTEKYGTISNYDASVGSGAASAVITWKADKKAAANYTYKLLKAECTTVWSNSEDSSIPSFKDLVEVDISNAKKTAGVDGSITYTVNDNTVEAGKNYAYFLQANVDGKTIWATFKYFTVSDTLNATQLNGTNSVDETVYVNIDSSKDYYAFKEVSFGKGATATAIVEKWNPETGYGAAAAVDITVGETPISEEDSLYQWNIIQKGITLIEEDEALKYTVTMTDAEGNKKVWYWYTQLTCKPTAGRATLNSITVLSKTATSANLEIKIGVFTDTKLEDVSVKLIVKKLINGGDSYTFVPVTVKAFVLDPAVGSAPATTATGTAQLTDLIKDTDYEVKGYIIVDGYNDGSESDECYNVPFSTLAN